MRKYFMGAIVGVMLVACISTCITGETIRSSGFQVESVSLACKQMNKDVTVDILIPESYRWDDEVYTQLVVMDSRSDEELAGLVSGFLSARDDVLPMVIIRVPESITEDIPVNDWLAFLNDKVFPYVEANYRTRPFRVLAGNRLTAPEAVAVGTKHDQTIHGVVALGVAEEPLSDRRIAEAVRSFSGQTSQRLSLFMVAKDDASQIAPFTSMEKELESEKDMRVRLVVYSAKHALNPHVFFRFQLFLHTGERAGI